MWVVPVKRTVPTGGSGGPLGSRMWGQPSGMVLVIDDVNVADLRPPPPVMEQPLHASADGPGLLPPVSVLVPVWDLWSWPRPGTRVVPPLTGVHLPVIAPAA